MMIANLVETMWLVRCYLWPVEIMYDQGVESPGHEFKNSLIDQEYGININPNSPRNLQANAIIERIHQLLGNLILTFNLHDTYVDDTDPWMRILTVEAFAVQYTYHQT